MAPPKIKICGINTQAAFDAVVEAGADYVGLNFFPPSPRFVAPAQAAALAARSSNGLQCVGLFVNPTDAEIEAVLAELTLDILQVYADAARCRAIKVAFKIPVWRAIGIAAAADLPVTDEALDGFVIEAKAPPGASRPGGNAAAFDISVLAGWQAPGFWLLAGGLTPENVAAVIAATDAPGVDVSSGVETAPGVKSADLIQKFVAAALSASRGCRPLPA
jgi:phosphoribosylanthranilate isomerase